MERGEEEWEESRRSVGRWASKKADSPSAAAAKLTKVFRSESAKGEERENHLSVCILGMTAKYGVVTTESRQRPRREEASPLRKLL